MMRHMEWFDKIVYFTSFLLLLLCAGVAYEYIYPWTIVKVNSFRVTSSGPVMAGGVVWYEVCTTKYVPIRGKVLLVLHNSTDKTLKAVEVDGPVGTECKQSYAYISRDTREDNDYYLTWEAQYDPTKLARTKIYRSEPSQKFEIVASSEPQGSPGPTGPQGIQGERGERGPNGR